MDKTFGQWILEESQLQNMSTTKARDLLIKCFFEAQKESISRGKKMLGLEDSLDEIEESVRNTIAMALKEVGGDFDNPDKDSLFKAVDVLARKVKAWGTPKDIIEHHKKQIARVLESIP